MVTIAQVEENIRALTEHADKFFAGTVTEKQLFELLDIAFASFSEMMRDLAKRGVLSHEQVGIYQWSSCLTATIIRTLEVGPKYGTGKLETQLRQNFRMMMKTASLVTGVVDAGKLPTKQ